MAVSRREPLLSNHEFGLLQRTIDTIVERVAALNLSLVVEEDFQKLLEFLQSRPNAFIYPSFDPRCSELRRDAFWLRAIDEEGRTVATHAERIFHCDDFYDLLESGTLWYADGVPEAERAQYQVKRESGLKIGGVVGHAGCMWVDPRFRKRGLSLFFPYLSRALCIRNYETDYHTGLVFRQLYDCRVAEYAYGFPHVTHCVEGRFPPSGSSESIFAVYMSRAESFEKMRELPAHPLYPLPV